MIWLLLVAVAALLIVPPFAWLSIGLAVRDLPQRFLDYLQARRECKERRRIFEARQANIKAVFDAIKRREF